MVESARRAVGAQGAGDAVAPHEKGPCAEPRREVLGSGRDIVHHVGDLYDGAQLDVHTEGHLSSTAR